MNPFHFITLRAAQDLLCVHGIQSILGAETVSATKSVTQASSHLAQATSHQDHADVKQVMNIKNRNKLKLVVVVLLISGFVVMQSGMANARTATTPNNLAAIAEVLST